MKKYLKTRTKSEVAHACPSPFFDEQHAHSRTAFVKFKPFSEECTILNIEERLQSYCKTATNFRPSNPTAPEEPIMSRLSSIIRGGRKHRRRNLTEVDVRSEGSSHNSHALNAKLTKLRRKSANISKRITTQPCEAREKEEFIVANVVRQDLSQVAVDLDNAFFETMHRPAQSQLLVDFNKSNCYVFSRSKHKVLAEDLQKPRFQPPEQPIVSSNGKFASFSTYFYGSYMKKYKERRRLLSKKTTLAKIVSQ